MGHTPRDEDGYLHAVGETLTEWNSPEGEAAWRGEALDAPSASEQESPPGENFTPLGVELGVPPREPPQPD